MAMHVPEPLFQKILVIDEDRWIAINKRIARILGKKEAEFLQELHYWLTTNSGIVINGVRWVYNTYKQWVQHFEGISRRTMCRIVSKLRNLGILLIANLNKKKTDQTNWYTIDYDALIKFIKSEESTDSWQRPECHFGTLSTNRTPENTVLNNARAREPFSAKNDFEYNPPETKTIPVEKAEKAVPSEPLKTVEVAETLQPVLSSTIIEPADQSLTPAQQPPKDTLSDEDILKILEEINLHLPEPVTVVTPVLRNTFRKRLRSHFGQGETGRANLKDYLTKCANNAFLMGQKAMKNGTLFVAKMAFLLSPKTIEASWENAGVFNIYSPKKTPDSFQEGAERSNPAGAETDTLPVLSLEEVLQTAVSETDKRVKETLYKTLGAVKYRVWFHAGEFVAKGFLGGELDFFIKGGFTRDYVLTHYGKELTKAFSCLVGSI